jgi:hypothetical protein
MSNWKSEHGIEYDVPEEIDILVDAGEIEDVSWHNDTCPSFTHGKRQMFVDHADPARREGGNGQLRYTVYPSYECCMPMLHTDNLVAAIHMLLTGEAL